MLLWTEQFSTGHKTLDDQHRVLFENINRLEGLVIQVNLTIEECDFIIGLLDYLESYAVSHFQIEEECMESHRCPAHQENREAHRHFIKAFHDLKEHCRSEGFRMEQLRHLHQFAEDWIRQHIMRIDVQLKPCVRGVSPS